MTENMKKFLELVSKDKELGKKLSDTGEEEIIAMAKELGVELTDADFAQQPSELADSELEAVIGGADICFCVAGGGGTKDALGGEICGCVLYGQGSGLFDQNHYFCCCVGFGTGGSIR